MSSPHRARPSRAYRAHDPRRASSRLLLGLLAGVATGVLIPTRFGWALRAVVGWDAGALVLVALCWWIIVRHDGDGTRRRAAAEDPGRSAVWLVILIASTFNVFASIFVLREAKHQPLELQTLFVGMCLLAVFSAWALSHTAYALRYAHLYYRDDGDGEGGLEFPGHAHPDYFDFAYFSFTVGMCFQVSDVAVTSRIVRRAVLGHAVLSFTYNTAIIAVALNLTASLFQ